MNYYLGRVRNSVIILDNGATLPEGTIVRIEPINAALDQAGHGHRHLMDLAGAVKDMPPDWAKNHDHYLHAQPKR